MPNFLVPGGGSPFLRGADIFANALNQYLGEQGTQRGSSYSGAEGGGLIGGSDRATEDMLIASLQAGKPVTSIPRTAREGLIPYGLSKLGLMSPEIQADPRQQWLESEVLRNKQRQDMQDQVGILGDLSKIAETAPELAKQFAMQNQGQMGGLQIDPKAFDNIYSRAQIAYNAEKEKEDYDRKMEEYRDKQAAIAQQRADIAQQQASAGNERIAGMLANQSQQLSIAERRLQDERDKADADHYLSLYHTLVTQQLEGSSEQKAEAARMLPLVERKLGIPSAPAQPTPAASGPGLVSRAGGVVANLFGSHTPIPPPGGSPASATGPSKPTVIPWKTAGGR